MKNLSVLVLLFLLGAGSMAQAGSIPACTAPQLVRADQGLGAFQDVPAAGGTFTMLVWPRGDCAWGISENSEILVNVAPTSGATPGPANYTVLANTGPARTAVISSGSSTFEIRQAAGGAPTPPATTPPVAPTPPAISNDANVLGVARTCSAVAMSTVKSAATLKPGTYVLSPSRQYKLIYQTDGNLVLYRASGQFLWNNGKVNVGGRLSMQSDGNLVSYDSAGKALWASNTSGKAGAVLAVQDDGNVVVYASAGCTALWSIR